MNYIGRNIENAGKVKILANVMFSAPLAEYVSEVADVHAIHEDALSIVLLNCVAATLEFSLVLRSNSSDFQMPTNLYNIVVARSAYGKSELTKLVRDMLKIVASHRRTKFRCAVQNIADDEVNPTLDEMSRAGLLSALDNCCRTLICDEADMTFADVGLFLTCNSYRTSTDLNCRGLTTSLFDRVSHPYVRQLAKQTVLVKRSKLNILGCSTGDIISNIVIRMKSGAAFDPSIGRFMFWALDGPVIPDKLIRRRINHTIYPSLKQFVLILSFIENVMFQFDVDAAEIMIEWGNSYKMQSYNERNNNESLSARLGKAVQYAYRFAVFLQTLEVGFEMCQLFIETYEQFPANGVVASDFVDKVSSLYRRKYSNYLFQNDPEPFSISKEVALRAIDVITGNMHQFMLLFDGTNAPRISSVGRPLIVVASDQQQALPTLQNTKESKKMHQRKQRYDFNFNRVAVNILLYPSVCFTIKQLHRDNALHNSGGIRLKVVVNKLVDSDILTVCPHGIKNSSKRTPVYIKQLPPEDESDQESYLVTALSEYTKDNQPLSFSAYKRSCNSFFLVTDGIIHDDVYQILGRPEYDTRDFFHLFHSQNPVDLQSPPPTDLDTVDNPADQIYTDQNKSQCAALEEILSPYAIPYDASPPISPLNERDNLFQVINYDELELNEAFNGISGNEQQGNSSSLMFDYSGQETDSNIRSSGHEGHVNQQILANASIGEACIPNKSEASTSNNAFYSPPSWRTRSKTKSNNQIQQKQDSSKPGDDQLPMNSRKRKRNESKNPVKKRAMTKTT